MGEVVVRLSAIRGAQGGPGVTACACGHVRSPLASRHSVAARGQGWRLTSVSSVCAQEGCGRRGGRGATARGVRAEGGERG
eukprot:scaffold33363_cov44-Phaeocystis_antarctica.AAC.1